MIKNGYLKIILLFVFSFLVATSFAQTTIKGNVIGEDKAPLPGVSVKIKGTTTGTVTDANGNFTINTETSNTLIFTFIGFTTKELALNGRETISVQLLPDSKALNEVVVVGYGTQRKTNVTGSIAIVKASELTQTPVVNVAQGLQSRVAGVQVTQNSSAPGGSISVRIRGSNSIRSSSEPLYVVDGIPFSGTGGGINEVSPLSTINPNDIESVSVLKDASSTAIYGSRGSNGVVLITTKRGKAGATNVAYESYYGTQNVTKTLDLLNATQFAELENEIYKTTIYPDPASLGQGVNWQKEIFREAPIQSHQLTLTGGNEKTRLALSGNYFNQGGIIINSDFKRYSMRLNLDHKINDRIKTGVSYLGSYTINKSTTTGFTGLNPGNFNVSILGAALSAPPTLQPYRENGSIYPFVEQFNGRYREVTNPLGVAAVLNRQTLNQSIINVFGEVSIVKGLTYRASLNAILQNNLEDYYSPLSILAPSEINANSGAARKRNEIGRNLLHESLLTYNTTFANDHSLKVTGLVSTQTINNGFNVINASGFPNDATTNEALQLALNRTVNSGNSEIDINSFMLRINYGFKEKYFLDLTGRSDGASQFGDGHKIGYFPSVGASWRIIEEKFMEPINFISDLKLRASYGVTGNIEGLRAYQSLALLRATPGYSFNHNLVNGIAPDNVPNPELKWEASHQTDIGLDVAFWKNRINFIVDVYNKKTNDLIYPKTLPLSSGYAEIVGNFGSIQNRGIEFSTTVKALDKAVKWDISGNVSINRNKIISIDGGDTQERLEATSYSLLKVGQPIGLFRTFVFDGIYQTGEAFITGSDSPRTGGVKVKDLNNDGEITDADQMIVGNPNPNFIFGFSTSLRYKKFDFSAFFSGSQGNDIYNQNRYTFENPKGQSNVLAGLANRWSPTNASNEFASGFQGGRVPFTDRFVEDGSYIRCKNITLGYTLPTIKGLKNARVYLSGNNLFTITDYSGYDPEVNSFGNSNVAIGIDNLVYPSARTILGGIQVNF